MFKYLIWAWPVGLVAMILYILIGVIPSLLMRLLGLKKIADRWAYLNVSLGSKFVLKLINVHVHVSGNLEELDKLRKNGEKICYVSNHTSMLDIPVVEGPLALSCGFITKKQIIWMPLINFMTLALNCVFIERGNLRKSAVSIKKGVKKIDKGASMLIFPEGTRSKTGEIGVFKHGAFKLAVLSQSYIVPLTIKGVRQAFEDRDRFFKRVDCYLHVGKSVNTSGLDREQIFDMENAIEKEVRDTYGTLGDR